MRLASAWPTGRAERRSSLDLYADAVRALGAAHPLARTQHAITIATRQGATTSALLVAAPWIGVVDPSAAIATIAAAGLVTATLCAVAAVLRSQRRAHVCDLILRGDGSAVELVRDESRRLLYPAHRTEIARRLGRTLHDAEHWDEYLPASRPPAGVGHLRGNGRAIREVVDALQADGVSARAVILVERFVHGGYGADAYHSTGSDAVRRELGRIRFELGERP
jgi:hypothetical protein